ncbi:hypothetical protein DB30_06240 [Enhygromyxa salina]|uniref:Uncharacterized protein n=2 Tax=Enhygromyxa salina TaxID=215803 RepID=A0A0C1ZV49_9BACT|nr:hypothetical protein DB30_06240 [Enhygromyxa salina]
MAAPPTASPAPRTVRLEVDADELGDKAIGMSQMIVDRVGPRVRAATFELVGDGDPAEMVLRVRLRVLKSGEYDYGVHFEFVDDGGGREPAIEWVDCHVCVDARLIPVLDEQLPALLMSLEARVEALADAREAGAADETPPPKVITGLGIGGAIVAAVGVGVLIGGGVEVSRGVVLEDGLDEQGVRTDHRAPGYALVGVGAAALVAGVILLGVDLGVQAKKRKQRAGAGQARVFPLVHSTSVGLGVSGKF